MDTASPVALQDWQAMVKSIYERKDLRDYSGADLLLHVIEESAKVDEGLRKDREDEVREAIPRVFIWLLSFCVRCNIKAEEVLWAKYQGLCPYCGAQEHCFCIANSGNVDVWHANPEGVPPASLHEYQAMFDRIYGRVNRLLHKIDVWLHFHEEIGEVSRAFRLLNPQKGDLELRNEFADAFAWLLGFCNRLSIDLGELAYQVYPGTCDVCSNQECTCPRM